MTLPSQVRANVTVPFPTNVQGSSFVTVTKVNGIWTVKVDYTRLAPLLVIGDPTLNEVVVYNTLTGQYSVITLATLIGGALYPQRIVTVAGDVTILPGDAVILMNKTVGAATNILLPTAMSRNGVPVTVKDYKGDAHTDNITFVPNGTETIDGFSGAAAAANGLALIDINYGKKTLFPLTAGGGWYL